MRSRIPRIIAAMLFTICLFSSISHAQSRHRPPRVTASRARSEPLTAEQKESIFDVIEQADELDVTYKYHPEKFADEVQFSFLGKCRQVTDQLPMGQVRTIMVKMAQAYKDAGLLYGSLTGTSTISESYDVFNEGQKLRGGKTYDYVSEILRRYKVENLEPYQAQRAVFHYASSLKNNLQTTLSKTPNIKSSARSSATQESSPNRVENSAVSNVPDSNQVEQNPQRLSGQMDELNEILNKNQDQKTRPEQGQKKVSNPGSPR